MPRRVSPAKSSPVPARKPALKSPLRTATMSLELPVGGPSFPSPVAALPAPEVMAQQVRLMQVSEFAAWLRTQTSPKTKRPFAEQTILGRVEPGGQLMPGRADEDGPLVWWEFSVRVDLAL
jgi:hypothetical protein